MFNVVSTVQSNQESHSKIIDTRNELTDTIKESFVLEEEVNEFFNNVDSRQCLNALLSDSSHSNYLV